MPRKKLLFTLSAALFLAFVYFSFLVSKERFVQIDFDTTVKLQDHISRKWDLPFSLLSIIGSVEITGFIWSIIFLTLLIRRYWLTVASLFLFWGSMAFEVFGKLFVYHPGPPFLFYRGVFKFVFPSSYAHTDYSYPSGHLTRTSFLVSFLIIFLFFKVSPSKRIFTQLGLAVFLLFMAISRVYLGEHWTTDVIGGTLLGSAVGTLTALTIPLRRRSEKKESGQISS